MKIITPLNNGPQRKTRRGGKLAPRAQRHVQDAAFAGQEGCGSEGIGRNGDVRGFEQGAVNGMAAGRRLYSEP